MTNRHQTLLLLLRAQRSMLIRNCYPLALNISNPWYSYSKYIYTTQFSFIANWKKQAKVFFFFDWKNDTRNWVRPILIVQRNMLSMLIFLPFPFLFISLLFFFLIFSFLSFLFFLILLFLRQDGSQFRIPHAAAIADGTGIHHVWQMFQINFGSRKRLLFEFPQRPLRLKTIYKLDNSETPWRMIGVTR